MNKILVIVSFIVLFSQLKAQNLQFFREDLTFKINSEYLSVDGIYFFCNVDSNVINKKLYYPFPVDKNYGKVDSISILNIENSEKIEFFKYDDKGIYFNVSVNSLTSKKYRIKYIQKLNSKKAEYILTSTQAWKKPFEIVNYKLIVPQSLYINSISYKADSVYIENSNKVYIWQKRDFMPTKNMIIEFD
jgi:hypothetical protein